MSEIQTTTNDRLIRVATRGAEIGEYSMVELRAFWFGGQLDREAYYLHPAGEWRLLKEIISDSDADARRLQQLAAASGPPRSRDGRLLVKTQRSRGLYVVLGLFLGGFGVHDFYVGRFFEGAMLLLGTALICLAAAVTHPGIAVLLGLFVALCILIELCTVKHDGAGDPLG